MPEKLQIEESRLIRILEAIQEVKESKGWSTLKAEIFDSRVNILEKELLEAARKKTPDIFQISNTAGQLEWAERFSDLNKLEGWYRTQLQGIRKVQHESD